MIRRGQGETGESERVRVFSKTNQGHGLAKIRFQETELLNSDNKWKLIFENTT